MRDRVIANIILLLLLMAGMFFLAPGESEVTTLHPSDHFSDDPSVIWVWEHSWSGTAYSEVQPGTRMTWSFGWGSHSRDALQDFLWDLEIELYINDNEVASPKRHFTFEDMGSRTERYWTLIFHYEHPPLPPGQHTWEMKLETPADTIEIVGLIVVPLRD